MNYQDPDVLAMRVFLHVARQRRGGEFVPKITNEVRKMFKLDGPEAIELTNLAVEVLRDARLTKAQLQRVLV